MFLPLLIAAGLVVPADLPSRFTALLERDDLAAVAAAAGPHVDPENADWFDLREVVVIHDCIDVHAATAEIEFTTDDSVSFRIDLAASGQTIGAVKDTVMLPPVWFVTFAKAGDGWGMRAVQTREGRLTSQLYQPMDDAARWELLRVNDYDIALLARKVNYRVDENPALIPFALELSMAAGSRAIAANGYAFATFASAGGRDLVRAAEYLQKAQAFAKESGDPQELVRADYAEAVVTWFQGDIDGGLAAFERAGSKVETLRDPRTAVTALYMGAHLEKGRGNIASAAVLTQRSAELARKYGWQEGELNGLASMALIHHYLGNRAEFVATNREAMRRAIALGRRQNLGAALYNLSNYEEESGNYAEAEALLLRAAAIWNVAAERVPARLGDLALAQQRYEEADRQYKLAFERLRVRPDTNHEVDILSRLSEVAVRRDRPDEALALARDAVTAASKQTIGDSASTAPWLPQAALGTALAALGRNEEAAASFEAAIDWVELEKNQFAGAASPGFLDKRVQPFFRLLDLHVSAGAVEEALAVAERMKARLLHDLLSRGQVDMSAVLTDAERAEDAALNARLVELNRTILRAGSAVTAEHRAALDKARLEQREFAVRMQLGHPELRAIAPPPTAGEIRGWLESASLTPSPSSLVLNYIAGDRETTLFALARDARGGTDVRVVTLPISKKELAKLVERLMSHVERRDLGYAEVAEVLYRRLLAPVESLLAGKSNVCIVPQGTLWQLPFGILRGPNGKHLIERAAVSYAPSLAYLHQQSGDSPDWLVTSPRVLVVGDPTVGGNARSRVRAMTRAELGALPEAAAEARQVGKLYEESSVLLRGEATEEAVKATAAQHDILHFATHGISQAAQPLYSSLVLAARTTGEDGLLEAREIARMDLRAQLAVLSACETARGGISEGEGVIGLSWAFLVAGCSRTIVTQWRADSAAAAVAMVHFHRGIARTKGGGSVAGALRDAQLALLRTPRYSHPYYWGGFVVVGAGW